MTKASRKKMEYIANYEADNYDKVLIRLPKGTKARIQATGATVNGFISSATLEKLAMSRGAPSDNSPATGGNVLLIEYPPEKLYNERIQLLIDAGITSSVSEYVGSVLFNDLDSELNFNGVSLWRYEHGTVEPRHK